MVTLQVHLTPPEQKLRTPVDARNVCTASSRLDTAAQYHLSLFRVHIETDGFRTSTGLSKACRQVLSVT